MSTHVVVTTLGGVTRYVVFETKFGQPLQAYDTLEAAQAGAVEWAERLEEWIRRRQVGR
jgi:hypothetical protein